MPLSARLMRRMRVRSDAVGLPRRMLATALDGLLPSFGLWLMITLNAVRLDARGEAQLAELGDVKHVVKLGFFHGRDDAYYRDHFGLRDRLLSWHNHLELAVGISPSRRVIIGREGWLFFGGPAMVEDYRNVAPFTDGQLGQWAEHLEQKRQWALSSRLASL